MLEPFESSPIPGRLRSSEPREVTSFSELYEGPLEAYPRRHRYAADHFWSDREPGALVALLAPPAAGMPSSKCHLLIYVPPEPDEPPPPGACFAHKGRAFIGCYAVWDDERADQAHDAWLDSVRSALGPVATGHYVGEVDLGFDPSRVKACFTPSSWQRLRTFTANVDPTRVFASPASATHPATERTTVQSSGSPGLRVGKNAPPSK
jgi:hypothetical protein